MGSTTEAAARDLVETIAVEHGHVRREVLDGIPDITTQEIIKSALKRKDGMIGSSVMTLAKNIYSSNALFVFELLQNADDNKYNKTDDIPFISYHVHPRKIVVENNEDGFTPENLRAICNVGQSTKIGAHGYIGKKGIGFKSVFVVAWKVLVQSGSFSFSFEHRNGDSGMGMISPEWHESQDQVDRALTRITLLLHDSCIPATEQIASQFRDLQDACLLFLKNIEKINITFYDADGQPLERVTHSIRRSPELNRATLSRVSTMNGETEEVLRYFHVTKHLARNLPKSEDREYSVEDETTKKYSESEIILAFPLTAEELPIVKVQGVFAFLPLEPAIFSFLIQADFVTNPNRRDVETTSSRNRGLLGEIANAFIKAILQFCEHPTLRHKWMRYLPDPKNIFVRPFWQELLQQIQQGLAATPVLMSRCGPSLRLLTSLKMLTSDALDQYGDPLLTDIEPPMYLSRAYLSSDLKSLEPYGLRKATLKDFLVRVNYDLASESSIIRTSKDGDWHSRFAKVLCLPFRKKWHLGRDALRALPILPMCDGKWMSANDGPVYFPTSAGIKIPYDLKMNLVDPIAIQNQARKTLFSHLGVTEATTSKVRSVILEEYASHGNTGFNLQVSLDHVEYLYLTHTEENSSISGAQAYSCIDVFPQEGDCVRPSQTDIYLPDDNALGVLRLLGPTAAGKEPGRGAPGLKIRFLHQAYLKLKPENSSNSAPSWTEFLSQHLLIRQRPRLTRFKGLFAVHLSEITLYVQRHRPDVFLQVLRDCWHLEFEKNSLIKSLIIELGNMKVLCEGDALVTLTETYLPTPPLLRLQASFMVEGESFPFLKLPTTLPHEAGLDKWDFLHSTIGVGKEDNLEFYLKVLESVLNANTLASTLNGSYRVYRVYGRIQDRLLESSDHSSDEDKIRQFFESRPAILVPAHDSQSARWTHQSECVWDGPDTMETKFPIKSLCEVHFAASGVSTTALEHFFKGTLEIPDCTWQNLIDEIHYIKSGTSPDLDQITDQYHRIYEYTDSLDSSEIQAVRCAFEDEALIYVYMKGKHEWLKASQCLWASATTISGRTILNHDYDDLEDFFVSVLGVSELDMNMVLDELVEKSAAHAPIGEVKDTLLLLPSFLQHQIQAPSPLRLLKCRIFPVKYPDGQVKLESSSTDFGIVDRQRHGDYFTGKAQLLDFDLAEVRLLRPFFRWTCLEYRFMSSMVKEISQHSGGDPTIIAAQDRDISRKASGLYRIAMHYDSPRVSGDDFSLYQILQRARVYETDGISSSLLLSQGGRNITADISHSELHISETSSGLSIYVPRQGRNQDFCYSSKLPPRLLRWIMTNPQTQIEETIEPEAVLAVTKVLNSSVASVDLILEEAGIIKVDFSESTDSQDKEPAREDEESCINDEREEVSEGDGLMNGLESASDHTSQSSTTIQQTSLTAEITESSPQGIWSSMPPEVTRASSRNTSAFPQPPRPSTEVVLRTRPTNIPSTFDPSSPPLLQAIDYEDHLVDQDSHYTDLLDRIIKEARKTDLPHQGPFDMSTMLQALPSGTENPPDNYTSPEYPPFRPAKRQERDTKIGAAGELFVFEILSNLSPALPNFSWHNWQSTIRKYISVHPAYVDMEAWNGRETADIIYDDSQSVFTHLLIDKGYLSESRWRAHTPRYYIEVKSTTKHCGTPWFMSRYQVKRMEGMRIVEEESEEEEDLESEEEDLESEEEDLESEEEDLESEEEDLESEEEDLENDEEEDEEHGEEGVGEEELYIVFRVFHLGSEGEMGVKVYVDPESMRREGGLVFEAENWSVRPGLGGGRGGLVSEEHVEAGGRRGGGLFSKT